MGVPVLSTSYSQICNWTGKKRFLVCALKHFWVAALLESAEFPWADGGYLCILANIWPNNKANNSPCEHETAAAQVTQAATWRVRIRCVYSKLHGQERSYLLNRCATVQLLGGGGYTVILRLVCTCFEHLHINVAASAWRHVILHVSLVTFKKSSCQEAWKRCFL